MAGDYKKLLKKKKKEYCSTKTMGVNIAKTNTLKLFCQIPLNPINTKNLNFF